MKPLAQFLCLCIVSGILYLAAYAYHQRVHPDLEHGYSKSDSDKVSQMLDSPKPVILHRDVPAKPDIYDVFSANETPPALPRLTKKLVKRMDSLTNKVTLASKPSARQMAMLSGR